MEKLRSMALECGAGDAAAIAATPVLERMTPENRQKAREQMTEINGLIAMVFPYYAGEEAGNLSLYARGEDYHRVARRAMEFFCAAASAAFPGAAFRGYADISPYPEVLIAARAGLGVIGCNGLLLTPRWGSYVFCGVIATDLPLKGGEEPRHCIECGRCIAACPGGALRKDGFCEEQCLSAISQKRGVLAPWEEQLLQKSELIWGCDRCQRVCPYNSAPEKTDCAFFSEQLLCSLSAEDLKELSDRQFRKKYADRAFSWRGIGPLRRNLELKKEKE